MKSTLITVGQPAPDFELTATDGVLRSLSAWRGSKIALIFYRGHWCSSCRGHLQRLRGSAFAFDDAGAVVLLVSSEPLADARAGQERDQLPFVLFSDPDLAVIDRYGARHEDEPEGRAIARPAVFLIDRAGVVRFAHVGEATFDRPKVELLLLALESIA